MSARSPWAGRWLPLLGIVLVALNVRTAVSSLSPIVHRVSLDIPLDELALGFIGMLPPIMFAVAGLLAPVVTRRIGLDAALVFACLAMVLGPILRATATGFPMLTAGSAVALLGMGFGNVLLPPAVKRYFPDRIGVVTSVYVTFIAVSTAVGAAFAEPTAIAAGWRVSLGMWAVLAMVALVPWVLQAVRRDRPAADVDIPIPVGRVRGLHRSPVAWSVTLAFMVSALFVYAMFAWMPAILVGQAGVSALDAGSLLALFSIIGLPLGLLAPVFATRLRNVGIIIQLGAACMVAAMAGLLFAPGAVVLWTVLAGCGGIIFPTCLVLINLRTRTEEGSIALSGFAQSLGYTVGALGPLGVAVLHDSTGSWTLPLVGLGVVALILIIPGFTLARPRYVEDELAAR